jgi:hypothetical protein
MGNVLCVCGSIVDFCSSFLPFFLVAFFDGILCYMFGRFCFFLMLDSDLVLSRFGRLRLFWLVDRQNCRLSSASYIFFHLVIRSSWCRHFSIMVLVFPNHPRVWQSPDTCYGLQGRQCTEHFCNVPSKQLDAKNLTLRLSAAARWNMDNHIHLGYVCVPVRTRCFVSGG